MAHTFELFFLFFLAPCLGHTDARKPNFLIIFVDDLGMNQISVPDTQRTYGYSGNNGTIHTPHISKLASEVMMISCKFILTPEGNL